MYLESLKKTVIVLVHGEGVTRSVEKAGQKQGLKGVPHSRRDTSQITAGVYLMCLIMH